MWRLQFRRIAKVGGSAYKQRHRNAKMITTVSGPPNLVKSSGLLVEKAKVRRDSQKSGAWKARNRDNTRSDQRPPMVPRVALFWDAKLWARKPVTEWFADSPGYGYLLQISSQLDLNYEVGFSCRMVVEWGWPHTTPSKRAEFKVRVHIICRMTAHLSTVRPSVRPFGLLQMKKIVINNIYITRLPTSLCGPSGPRRIFPVLARSLFQYKFELPCI